MASLNQISPDDATGRAKELLNAVKGKLGLVPNMTRAMANAPPVLDGYLKLSGALGHGTLPARVREQIALAVAQVNGCEHCLAAHSSMGRRVGLTADQIRDSRLGAAVESKADALVRFALKVVNTRGAVSDGDLDEVRGARFDDTAIAEVMANAALHVFTNYFNRLAGTNLDFPEVPELRPGAATMIYGHARESREKSAPLGRRSIARCVAQAPLDSQRFDQCQPAGLPRGLTWSGQLTAGEAVHDPSGIVRDEHQSNA